MTQVFGAEMSLEVRWFHQASFSPQKKHNAWGGLPFVDVNPIKAYAS